MISVITSTWSNEESFPIQDTTLYKSFKFFNPEKNFHHIHFNRGHFHQEESEFNAKYGSESDYLLYKITLLKQRVSEIDSKYIIFCDANDVFCLGNVDYLLDHFDLDNEIIIGHEKNRWPPPETSCEWPSFRNYSAYNIDNNIYLNSGMVLSSLDNYIKLLDSLEKNILNQNVNFRNDQGVFAWHYTSESDPKITLDEENIFTLNTFSRSPEEYSLDGNKLINKVDSSYSCFIHDNGWNHGSPKFSEHFNLSSLLTNHSPPSPTIQALPNISLHSHHNASVAVELNGDIITVIELERFVNLKNASHAFFSPIRVQDVVLGEIYEYLKFKYGFAKYDNFIISEGYKEVPEDWKKQIPANNYIVDERHHAAHAASSFYQSPFEEALIISFDGGSNDGWFNIFHGKKGEDLIPVANHSFDLGSHYHVIGGCCEDIKNYDHLTAAGKVLGLQSYGKIIENWIAPLTEFFKFVPFYHELDERIEKLSNSIGIEFSKIKKLSGDNQYNLARTAQHVFESIFFECTDDLINQFNLPIIITGGCALNIVLNTKVKKSYPHLDVFVAPNSSDCGLTVGSLCNLKKPKKIIDVTYKGVGILDRHLLMEYVNRYMAPEANIESIASDLFNKNILGLVQGDSEHGPRSLGNRSILCSPISPDMKDILNEKVKRREWFRPFAPIVRLEDVSDYFEWEGESRWMNFCPKVKEEWKERLPAITHVDGTARVQTITKEQNPLVYDIITKFKDVSGVGVLVNTSFNVDGKPILSSIKDAFDVFDNTLLDRLYIEGYYFTK